MEHPSLVGFFRFCGALFLLAIIGGVGGFCFAILDIQGTFTQWHSLGQPPAPISTFVPEATGRDEVVVRTENDGVYLCRISASGNCWIAVTTVPSPSPLPAVPCSSFRRASPPGQMKDSLAISACYSDAAFITEYVLLKDNTVWYRSQGGSAYINLFEIIIAPILGTGLTSILGSVILFVRWWQRRNRKPSITHAKS